MTIMSINIDGDLKRSFEEAFPGEPIEKAIERLLRAEIARRRRRTPEEVERLLAEFDAMRAKSRPLSDEEIRRLRDEGRP
jgi:hypothetical protein